MPDETKNPGCPMAPEGWEARYLEGTAGWDLGGAPPALRTLAPTFAAPLRVLVPGCGYGHDAIAWARAGHVVVGVDFAPSAIEGARRRAADAGVEVEWRQVDVFALPAALSDFDLVWEQTCYCAIQPEQRAAYVAAMAAALKPGGRFLGLFWNHGMEGGPPFDITREDVLTAFASQFEVESIEDVAESVPTRKHEFLARMVRR